MDVLTQFFSISLCLLVLYFWTIGLRLYRVFQYLPALLFVVVYALVAKQGMPALLTYLLLMLLVMLANNWQRLRWPLRIIAVLFGLVVALRWAPVFPTIGPIATQSLSLLSGEWSVYAGINKALVGLILLPLVRYSDLKLSALKQHHVILLVGPFLVACLAYLSGVNFDFKFSEFTLLFILSNLVFTVIAEEVFFRGLIQQYLVDCLPGRYRIALGIFIASCLFGAVHIGGGWHFALLAGVAGIVYGIAYWRLRSLWAAVLTHLSVNALHFVFLEYPGLAN